MTRCYPLIAIVLGRDKESVNVYLNSSTPLMISRIHATIKATTDGALLVSQGVNGVIVNGVAVQKHHLRAGDVIVFGGAGAGTKAGVAVKNPQSELRYEYVAAAPTPAPIAAPQAQQEPSFAPVQPEIASRRGFSHKLHLCHQCLITW